MSRADMTPEPATAPNTANNRSMYQDVGMRCALYECAVGESAHIHSLRDGQKHSTSASLPRHHKLKTQSYTIYIGSVVCLQG